MSKGLRDAKRVSENDVSINQSTTGGEEGWGRGEEMGEGREGGMGEGRGEGTGEGRRD